MCDRDETPEEREIERLWHVSRGGSVSVKRSGFERRAKHTQQP